MTWKPGNRNQDAAAHYDSCDQWQENETVTIDHQPQVPHEALQDQRPLLGRQPSLEMVTLLGIRERLAIPGGQVETLRREQEGRRHLSSQAEGQ